MDQDMEAISGVVFVVVTVSTLVAGLIGGFYFAKAAGEIVPPVPQPEEETDDPTAPITPMIEIGRSPHDRHRDLNVGNALIKISGCSSSSSKADSVRIKTSSSDKSA